MQIRICKLFSWLTHQNKTKIDSDEDADLGINYLEKAVCDLKFLFWWSSSSPNFNFNFNTKFTLKLKFESEDEQV